MLLQLSARSAGSEFQIVGAAWQNMRLPKTVLAPETFATDQVAKLSDIAPKNCCFGRHIFGNDIFPRLGVH